MKLNEEETSWISLCVQTVDGDDDDDDEGRGRDRE
jgi:hypothetical protein